MYPLIFERVLVKKVWGGRNFEEKLGISLPDDSKYGETWEISTHPHGQTVILNGFLKGKTLQEALLEQKEKLVGQNIYSKYMEKFPLLIKYLDVQDRLSIQVHPSDDYALKKHNEFGKCESWYIMYASEDAKLIMGMKENVSKEEFIKKTNENDFSNLFNEISVKQGDIIDILPGTVHASLTGSVIFAEIQQNSDVTYRIYDFDRYENGKKRELHLDLAADVINFDYKPIVRKTNLKNNEKKIKISETQYYYIEKLKIDDQIEEIENEMNIYMVTKGNGILKYEDEEINLKIGSSILLPPNVKAIISGDLEMLKIKAK